MSITELEQHLEITTIQAIRRDWATADITLAASVCDTNEEKITPAMLSSWFIIARFMANYCFIRFSFRSFWQPRVALNESLNVV